MRVTFIEQHLSKTAHGVSNMQLWQQQLMYKQLQELRKQQQLQQLDQGSRQLGPVSQLSAVAKPVTGDQFPSSLNEVPLNDTYNYMPPNSFVGGASNLPGNSQMFIGGNMNWVHPSCSAAMQNLANGLIISNDQSQAMQSMGFLPQQIDQSFHDMPVSGTSCVNQYSHLRMSNNFHDLMNKTAANRAEKASYPSSTCHTEQQVAAQGCLQDVTLSTTQNFQEKHVFGNSPVQVLGNDATSGNFQQLNNLQPNIQFQEFHGRKGQDDSSGNLPEKPVSQVGTSTGVASLDPIEQKLLFGTDDDNNWGLLFGGSLTSGMGGEMHGHPKENDCYGAFPSIHSGSWSALMQEAVQATSSDKGLQEEWSGLSFQKTEQLIVQPLVTNNDNMRQPADLDDGNLKIAALTSRAFPLFNETNATPYTNASNNLQPFKSAYEENNRALSEAPHVSFKSSSRGSSEKEIHQSENQTQLVEGSLQVQMTASGGVCARQTIEQHENRSGDIQSKSQDIGDGWGNQQNSTFSNVSSHPVNKLNGWNTSYRMASRSENISNFHGSDSNLWKTSENYVNLKSGLQPVKSDVGNRKMQAEDSLGGNFGSVRNPNTLKLNQEMHQQLINAQQTVFGQHFALNTCVNSEGDKDVEENQNHPSRRLQTWELSTSTAAERSSDNCEKEKEHGRVVLGEGYVGHAAKDKFLLTGNGQNPSVSGSRKSSILSGQHTVESKMFQNSLGGFRKTAEPSCLPNHLSLQGLSNSVFHGMNSEEQSFVGKSQFAGHIVSNDPMDVSKKAAVGAEELQSRNTAAVCASSSPFDGSTAQYSQNETIAQSSYNILELLHKVDQSKNGYSLNVSEVPAQAAAGISISHPPFDQPSNSRGFGLRLAPPSQRQQLPHCMPISQNSSNDINCWKSDHEAECQDQALPNSTSSTRSAPPLDVAYKGENWDKTSSLSGQEDNEHSEANKNFNSLSATNDFSLAGNHLQEQQQQQLQQQHMSGAKGHLEKQQQQWQRQHISNASLPTQAGRTTSGVASFGETCSPVDSQFSSGRIDHTKPTFAGFSQITSSGQQLPDEETKPGSQSSISGLSQQVGFSNMLHNVWTNISAQQCQAGINHLLTPNVLQSIMKYGRDTSSGGLSKEGDKINTDASAPPEVGTSSTNSQIGEEYPVQSKSLNLIQTEKVDVARKSKNSFQQEEAMLKPTSDGGSIGPISSLVHPHQQDVNKAKNVQDSALRSQVLCVPATSIVSSSSDIGISGRMSKTSDMQQQNYSLLHQVQLMKASDSDLNKMTGNTPKGSTGSSNSSHMNFSIDQRFDRGQNAIFRIPEDGKVGEDSHISSSSDAKMLSFASNDSEVRNPSTSTAERHDIQNHMHPVSTSSTVNVLGGSERSQINPQMAPSWFERYGMYQNGRMAALFAAQRSGKAAIQQSFLQKVPVRMEDSNVAEQRLDSSHVDSYGQGTLAINIAPNESTSSLPPPDIDKDITLRSKKRKSASIDPLPWRKMVTRCPQRLQSISMPELDWAQAANRLIEKVDDEAETMDDGVPQLRRRLILTTQLMHQLVPAVPSAMIKGEATSAYESVTFSVAKSALADACSLVSSSESDSHMLLGKEITIFGELNTPKKARDDTFSKFVEDFIDRSKKLETDFSRLEKRTSILDVRLECQELERFSIVNRLGKFHGRTHTDGVEVSSTSETAYRRIYPQRYITALPVSGNLPEGVLCLSL